MAEQEQNQVESLDVRVHGFYPTQQQQEPSELELSDAERKRCEDQCRKMVGQLVASSALYPIAFARTLVQLGHEPYPMVKGKKWIFFGQEKYYLPNLFKYVSNVYNSHGFATIYTGIGANVFLNITGNLGSFAVSMYLDHFYPEVGGDITDLDEKVKQQPNEDHDAFQLFRVHFRKAVRESIANIAGIIISRPFAVIMIRQIAQHIGNDIKYESFNPIQPLLRIGNEEGPAGLFAGLMPNIIAGLVQVWGVTMVNYGLNYFFKQIEKGQEVDDDPEAKRILVQSRNALDFFAKFAVSHCRYPFEVVSTVMAVTGSGLFVSLLPYSPVFSHWTDAYHYLKPNELYRGAKVIMREEKGSIRVGMNNEVYASKKHFI